MQLERSRIRLLIPFSLRHAATASPDGPAPTIIGPETQMHVHLSERATAASALISLKWWFWLEHLKIGSWALLPSLSLQGSMKIQVGSRLQWVFLDLTSEKRMCWLQTSWCTHNQPTLLLMKAWAREKDRGDMLCESPEDTVKTDANAL